MTHKHSGFVYKLPLGCPYLFSSAWGIVFWETTLQHKCWISGNPGNFNSKTLSHVGDDSSLMSAWRVQGSCLLTVA